MTQSEAILELTSPPLLRSPRINSIDLLRGLVLILMALDHTRIFFSFAQHPTDLSTTTPLLYFTRWVTNLCAPVFIFLAGVSTYLYSTRPGRTLNEVALFLVTRGLWFIIAEMTIIVFIWTLFLKPYHIELAVFWTFGVSMIALAALIYLPKWMIAIFCMAVIAGHNLFDTVSAESLNHASWLWKVLHQGGDFDLFQFAQIEVGYPVMPWIAVMAAGYLLGPIFILSETKRRKFLICLGLILCAAFVILRYTNVYGDPHAWVWQKDIVFTLMSFLNCEKYPPSLLYLLMTLGVAFVIFGLISEKFCQYFPGRVIVNFGKVPFLFYILHVLFINCLAVIVVYFKYDAESIFKFELNRSLYGYDLSVVYLVWLGLLLALYPFCYWYGKVKASSRSAILSYL